MVNPPWLKIAVGALMFLELSDDETVDPDAAVAQMENIAALLQSLPPEEIAEFLDYFEHLARQEEQQRGNPEVIAFLRTIGENFGLT